MISPTDQPSGTILESDSVISPDNQHTDHKHPPVHGILVGVLARVTDNGEPSVTFPDNLAVLPVMARSATPVHPDDVGKEVALLFENGDISKPIVMGLMQKSISATEEALVDTVNEVVNTNTLSHENEAQHETELLVDGERIDINAREQIVLRCGKSSITMTSAGKVIIRGTYVSTRSSGANRIKGGSVQIN